MRMLIVIPPGTDNPERQMGPGQKTTQESLDSSVISTSSTDVSLPLRLDLKRRLYGIMLGTISGRTRAPMCSLIAATFAACALSLLAARPADAQQPNPASEIRRHVTGSFRFVDPGSNHPITVWFCRHIHGRPRHSHRVRHARQRLADCSTGL